MTPTLTAATDWRIAAGLATFRRSPNQETASASATYAPVIAAVRVPPSACRTSQSIAMLFSPSAPRSIAARSARPISRLISWVRPPIRPLTDSRSLRVCVARGSIEYSAVTQPRPEPFRQRGTPSVTLAAQSTRVRPNSTSTEPSAWSSQLRLMVTGRSWSAARPSGRVTHRRVMARGSATSRRGGRRAPAGTHAAAPRPGKAPGRGATQWVAMSSSSPMRSELRAVRTGGVPVVVDLTDDCADFVREEADGLLHVFVPHATAGLAIIETGAGSDDDLLAQLDQLLPRDARWRPRHGSPGHGRDHVLPAFVPPHASVPVLEGRLQLGT